MKFEEQLKQFKESLNFPKNFGVSDYNILMKEIKKIIIDKALNSELDYHLEEESDNNSRNGYSSKTIKTEGMSTRDTVSTFEEIYGIDESPTLVSRVTENVMESILNWQNKPLCCISKRKEIKAAKRKINDLKSRR